MKSLFTKHILTCAVVTALMLGAAPARATIIGITSVDALGSSRDTYDWSELSGFAVTSTGGNTATATGPSGFEVLTQGTTWNGDFAPGTAVLFNLGGPPDADTSLTFAHPVAGAGAKIDGNGSAPITAGIEAFDSSNHLLGSFAENGITSNANDDSAIFIGILGSTDDIAKIKIFINNPGSPAFAIGPLSTASADVSAVPLPPSMILFSTALAGLAACSWINRRKGFT